MKHASLKDSVSALRRCRPRTHHIPGQLFPDLVTGERGRDPVLTAVSYHVDTTGSAAPLSSSTGASSAAVTSSIRTLYDQFADAQARAMDPHMATPFDLLFSRYVQHRHGEVRSLLEHPDAPPPAEFLERVCAVGYPDFQCFRSVIVTMLERDRLPDNGATRVWQLYQRCEHLQGPVNDPTYELVDLLIRLMASVSASDAIVDALHRIPNDSLRPETWDLLLVAVVKRRLRSTEILWRLVGPQSFAVTPSGQFGLSAELATMLLTRARMDGHTCAPPLVAKAIMNRYFEFCAATQVPLHPAPFLFFFKMVLDTRAGTDSTVFHWHIVWEYFQKLNRECPRWYETSPEEAKHLCCSLIDIMLRGADPWMVLNVSRAIAERRIVDGFDLSLRILRRLEPHEHHPAETRAVARKLFSWLIDVVRIHLLPAYHKRLIPAMQVLLRLGLMPELSRLHNALLDNITVIPEQLRTEFVNAFSDVLCLSCHSIMPSADVRAHRQCMHCFATKLPRIVVGYGGASSAAAADERGGGSSADRILLAAVEDHTDVLAEGIPKPLPLDGDVIDVSREGAETSRELKAQREALQHLVASKASRDHQRGAPSSSSAEGSVNLRRSTAAVADAMPDSGTVRTAAQYSASRAALEEEKASLKGVLAKLHREQPTRKGLRERAAAALSPSAAFASAGASKEKKGRDNNNNISTKSTLLQTPAAEAAAAGVFVPAVEGEEGAGALPSAASTASTADLRASLEDSTNREMLKASVHRMALTSSGSDKNAAAATEAQTAEDLPPAMRFSTEGESKPEAALPPPVSQEHAGASATRRHHRAAAAKAKSSNNKNNAKKHNEAAAAEADAPPKIARWSCVWCQESHSTSTSDAVCAACGAETGPAAPWRTYAFATAEDAVASITAAASSSSSQAEPPAADAISAAMAMEEIRQRILHCYEEPEDAIVAAYYLMVYRKLFLLRATASDLALVEQLVAALAMSHQSVLAAFVYLRLVPAALRRLKAPSLQRLASLYGTATTKGFASLTLEELQRVGGDAVVCAKVLGPSVCRVCFGPHEWHACPIVTRDFRTMSSRVRLSPEEQEQEMMDAISAATRQAARLAEGSMPMGEPKSGDAPQPSLVSLPAEGTAEVSADAEDAAAKAAKVTAAVVSAYKQFIVFRHREDWATRFPSEANALSQLLAKEGASEMLRASFVLCHIPVNLRENASYLGIIAHFGRSRDDVLPLLSRRSPPHVCDNSHPNFVQVTLMCCVCLEASHASYACPNIKKWRRMAERTLGAIHSDKLALAAGGGGGRGGSGKKNASPDAEAYSAELAHGADLHQLRALVDGWTYSGTERLVAFYRFLLANVDALAAAPEASQPFSPVRYAINTAICRLTETGHVAHARRLFARTPVAMLDPKQAIVAIMVANGVRNEVLQSAMACPIKRAKWLAEGALPVFTHCLICFDSSHGFHQCPELATAAAAAHAAASASTTSGGLSPEAAAAAARVKAVISNVGGIRCTRIGANAAADYVVDAHRRGEFTSGLLRRDASLSEAVGRLATLCFAGSEVFRGRRLLRLMPPEVIPMPLLEDYWRAAGLSEAQREESLTRVEDFWADHSAAPHHSNNDKRSSAASASHSHAAPLSSKKAHVFWGEVERRLCQRCGDATHTVASCGLSANEGSFARDIISVFRTLLTDTTLSPQAIKLFMMRFAKFILLYHRHLPYEYSGVQSAVNSTAAILAMSAEPGIALRLLLAIPAASRLRHTHAHILRCIGLTQQELDAALATVHSRSRVDDTQTSYLATLTELTPIPDTAVAECYGKHEALMAAMRVADEVVLSYTDPSIIVKENEVRARMLTATSGGAGYDLADAAEVLRRLPPITIRPHQFADVLTYRHDFTTAIQTPVENALGCLLGSNHIIFQGIEVQPPAATAAAAEAVAESEHEKEPDIEVISHEHHDEPVAQAPSASSTGGPSSLRYDPHSFASNATVAAQEAAQFGSADRHSSGGSNASGGAERRRSPSDSRRSERSGERSNTLPPSSPSSSASSDRPRQHDRDRREAPPRSSDRGEARRGGVSDRNHTPGTPNRNSDGGNSRRDRDGSSHSRQNRPSGDTDGRSSHRGGANERGSSSNGRFNDRERRDRRGEGFSSGNGPRRSPSDNGHRQHNQRPHGKDRN